MNKVWILKMLSKLLAEETQSKQSSSFSVSNGNKNTVPLNILTYFK